MFVQHPVTKASTSQRRLIQGVGINDADYLVTYKDEHGQLQTCPLYSTWASLLNRCFNPKLHAKRPSYIGCTLHEPWKTFSQFRVWMERQDWQGKHLDKDLLAWDSKHYSPSTCLFISAELNNLLTLRRNHRGDLPLGVSRTTIKGYEYFVASCSFYGKQKRLGYFKTPEDAAAKYREERLKYIAELAGREKDPRIRQALLNLH